MNNVIVSVNNTAFLTLPPHRLHLLQFFVLAKFSKRVLQYNREIQKAPKIFFISLLAVYRLHLRWIHSHFKGSAQHTGVFSDAALLDPCLC